MFLDTASAVANAGVGIYNAFQSSKQNSINNAFAERNAKLQEDVAYNGLGIRISDAERNGISKWSVVGDSATAGQISNNTEPARADKFDAIADAIQMKNMRLATEKLAEDKKVSEETAENAKYQREYAKEHALPIGIQPGIEQSLLGWLDTEKNRKLIEDIVSKVAKNAGTITSIIEKGSQKVSDIADSANNSLEEKRKEAEARRRAREENKARKQKVKEAMKKSKAYDKAKLKEKQRKSNEEYIRGLEM